MISNCNRTRTGFGTGPSNPIPAKVKPEWIWGHGEELEPCARHHFSNCKLRIRTKRRNELISMIFHMTLWPWLHCSTKLLIKNIALQTAKGSANLSAEKCNMNRGGTASYLAWPGGEVANMAKVQNRENDTQKRGWQKVGMYNNIILSTYFSLVTAWLYWLTQSWCVLHYIIYQFDVILVLANWETQLRW